MGLLPWRLMIPSPHIVSYTGVYSYQCTAAVNATTTGSPMSTYTGGAMGMLPGAGMAVAGAIGIAAALV